MTQEIAKHCQQCIRKIYVIKDLVTKNDVKLKETDEELYNSCHEYHLRELRYEQICLENFKYHGVTLDPSHPDFEKWKKEFKERSGTRF